MLQAGSSAVLCAAACRCCCQQVPGAVKLAQVLGGSLLQHIRHVAQPARQMELPVEISIDSGSMQPSCTPNSAEHQQQRTNVDQVLAGAAVCAQPAVPEPRATSVMYGQQHLHQQRQEQQQPLQQPMQQPPPALVHPHQPPSPALLQPHQPPSPSGVKKTFYKRKLPCPPATEFSSSEGRLLFAEALQQGTMTGFFKLIEQYSTQDEPAFCGLASIAMVLNALSIDPKRPWKGSWRWFHEQLLDCCLPLSKVAQEGVVLTQAACLAKCNGAHVTLHRSGTFGLQEFRQAVIETCSSGEEHLVVSYTRKAFGQTGDGHFSPIGGYHGGRDLVLILDTARFKYPPHWVPLPMLFDAMAAVDPSTSLPRGYLRLSANAAPDSVLFTLDIRPDSSWRSAESFIQNTAPQLVKAAAADGQATPEALLQQLVALAPLSSVPSFIAMRFAAQSCARDRCVPHTVRQQVLRELRATPLHQALQPLLAQHLAQQQQQQGGMQGQAQQQQQGDIQTQQQQQQGTMQELHPQQQHQQQQHQQQQHQQQQQQQDRSFLSEKLTVLLLLQEPSAWGDAADWAHPAQYDAWQHLLDASAVSILEGEVGYLRQQLRHIDDVLQVSSSASGSCGGCTEGAGGQSADVASGAAAVAGGVDGVGGVESGLLPWTSPCSSCIFQHDCSLKGCINKHGEVEVAPATAAASSSNSSSSRALLGAAGQQQQQGPHGLSSGLSSSSGCCSSGAVGRPVDDDDDALLAHHGCCS